MIISLIIATDVIEYLDNINENEVVEWSDRKISEIL